MNTIIDRAIELQALHAASECGIPVNPRSTMALLRAYGHEVTCRINRNGSARYRVNGSRELTALQMTRKANRMGILA